MSVRKRTSRKIDLRLSIFVDDNFIAVCAVLLKKNILNCVKCS